MPPTHRRRLNRKAREIVTVATEKGYSYEKIAKVCEVSLGSVKRWLATGKADAHKIQHIEELIGPIYISADSVSDQLVEIYLTRNKRYRLRKKQLKKIAGRRALKASFVEAITVAMLNRDYYFLEGYAYEEDYFIIISIKQLNWSVRNELSSEEIQDYYQTLSEDIVEED